MSMGGHLIGRQGLGFGATLPAESGAEEGKERRNLGNEQDLPLTKRISSRGKIIGDQDDLPDERFSHVVPPVGFD